MTLLLGLFLGAIVGSVLGLIGAGGAILAVPGLIAVLGLSLLQRRLAQRLSSDRQP